MINIIHTQNLHTCITLTQWNKILREVRTVSYFACSMYRSTQSNVTPKLQCPQHTDVTSYNQDVLGFRKIWMKVDTNEIREPVTSLNNLDLTMWKEITVTVNVYAFWHPSLVASDNFKKKTHTHTHTHKRIQETERERKNAGWNM